MLVSMDRSCSNYLSVTLSRPSGNLLHCCRPFPNEQVGVMKEITEVSMLVLVKAAYTSLPSRSITAHISTELSKVTRGNQISLSNTANMVFHDF